MAILLACLGIVVWIVAGIVAYGLCKEYWRNFYQRTERCKHDRFGEAICIIFGLLGPLGLLFVFSFLKEEIPKFRLCFRIPEELRKKRS